MSNKVGKIGDLSIMQPVPLSAQAQLKFWREKVEGKCDDGNLKLKTIADAIIFDALVNYSS